MKATAKNTTTKKICAGYYCVTNGTRTVNVQYMDHLASWMAIAEWDKYTYSDPVATKREAVAIANEIIQAAE